MTDTEPRAPLPFSEPPQRGPRMASLRTVLAVLALAVAATALGIALTRGSSAPADEPATSAAASSEATTQEQAPAAPGGATTSQAHASVSAAISVYRDDAAGVVEVTARSAQGESPFGGGSGALGTGFVIDGDGHIVTNEHVVATGGSVNVTFADGKTMPARIVGTDVSTDTALLQVDAGSELHPLELGDSATLVVGQDVYAIGNPFGLDRSLTAGIVSALDRDIQAPNGYSISGVIQTDAAINSGNSGGPLLDAQGRVVGVTAQIESRSGGNVGIGYAIPINLVRAVVGQLASGRTVRHAYLGVSLAPVSKPLARSLGLPDTRGAYVADVLPGGPAADAGLRGGENGGGDVIRAAGGTPVETPDDLTRIVSTKKPGDRLELEIFRDGSTETVTVTLGERPSAA